LHIGIYDSCYRVVIKHKQWLPTAEHYECYLMFLGAPFFAAMDSEVIETG
jgi:hypothetical protein